jgi:signal recognition particle receptor subunit beta
MGSNMRSMPLVFQYNKQDLPPELILTGRELDDALNFWDIPSFSSDAVQGKGVFETLRAISESVLRKLSTEAPR